MKQTLQPVAAMLVAAAVLYQTVAGWGHAVPAAITFWYGYLVYVLASVHLFVAAPPSLRTAVVLALSAAFAWVALSPAAVYAGTAHVLAMYAILALVRPPRLRFLAFAAWMVAFNTVVPRHLLHLEAALAHPGGPHYVLAVLLARVAWRSVFVYYEVAGGTVDRISLPSLATYLCGLPFLGGQTIALSYRHFTTSRAATPEDLHASVQAGVRTLVGCVAALTLCLVVARSGVLGPPPAQSGLASTLAWVALWFVGYFLWRYACEQGSVGICRLLGHRVRDDFSPAVLLSRSHVAFWRGWNALWREFLMAWIYYPTIFRLGRRFDARHPAVIAAAGFATCVADVVFDFFPFVLFFVGEALPTVGTCLALVANHIAWGLLVGANLYVYAAWPGARAPRWAVPLQIAFTLSTVVLLQVFKKEPSLGAVLWRAAGLP